MGTAESKAAPSTTRKNKTADKAKNKSSASNNAKNKPDGSNKSHKKPSTGATKKTKPSTTDNGTRKPVKRVKMKPPSQETGTGRPTTAAAKPPSSLALKKTPSVKVPETNPPPIRAPEMNIPQKSPNAATTAVEKPSSSSQAEMVASIKRQASAKFSAFQKGDGTAASAAHVNRMKQSSLKSREKVVVADSSPNDSVVPENQKTTPSIAVVAANDDDSDAIPAKIETTQDDNVGKAPKDGQASEKLAHVQGDRPKRQASLKQKKSSHKRHHSNKQPSQKHMDSTTSGDALKKKSKHSRHKRRTAEHTAENDDGDKESRKSKKDLHQTNKDGTRKKRKKKKKKPEAKDAVDMVVKAPEENGRKNGGKDDQVDAKTLEETEKMVSLDKDFENEIEETLKSLRLDYCLDLPLSKRDGVMVMQGWNKMLAFKTAFEEALLCKWRILVAKEELDANKNASVPAAGNAAPEADENELLELSRATHKTAIELVENCQDPIAECFGTRLFHMEELLTGMLDGAVRAMCPQTQVVAREAYRPINDDRLLSTESGQNEAQTMHLECKTLDDYFHLFAQCGVRPRYWVLFCDAFLWAMQTHVFYADEHDEEELAKPRREGAFAKFVAGQVATPAIQAALKLRQDLCKDIFAIGVPRVWRRISQGDENKAMIGETFYRNLLTNYPELLDYFARADMDSLALHLVLALDLCVDSVPKIGQSRTAFRKVLDHLGEVHLKLGIPTYAYALVGSQLLDTLKPFFEEEEELARESDYPVTAKALDQAFGTLYTEVMSFTYHPMLRQEKIYAQAEDFFEKVAQELSWSPGQLSKRLFAVKLEISSTGTYTHTSQELEIGARLAWRNSAKCVGRIAWNTLMVRDCRHMEEPYEIFDDVVEHLKIATGGTNIQSVMTVYKPRGRQTWGVRFWSSQFVRYACYKDKDTGQLIGDPANKDMTDYLIRQKLWTPPKPRTAFDILPLVLKIPGEQTPYVFQLPEESVHEVAIEHPKCPEIAELGLRWGTVPAISNFNMNLGGVDYQCMPFNGWFLSTEVVRNLLERYKVGPKWAEIMRIDTSEDMWEQKVACEVDTAILHSFRKKMYTVVDPVSCGKSFLTHVVRERETHGRECPGQWSWIGGFLGHTNVTWHLEMRDFLLFPQYEYCADSLLLMDDRTTGNDLSQRAERRPSVTSPAKEMSAVKVLIAYGSETGNAEAVAMRLARSLRVLRPLVKCLNDVSGLGIISEEGITHMLVLCSTFGKGNPPQNAELFFHTDIPAGTLKDTQVAVLALGSTLYPDYCRAGVLLEQKLEKAGRKRLVPLEKADSAIGAEAVMADWSALVKGLVLPPHLEAELSAKLASGATSVVEHKMNWHQEEEQQDTATTADVLRWKEDESCLCIVNDELLVDGDIASRSTRRIVFELPETATYESGDHLCVDPLNDTVKVRRFARCFRTELMQAAAASGRCPFIADCQEGNEKEDSVLEWQLRQQFTVDCIEDGATTQATLSFKTPATLWDVLQANLDFALHQSLVPDFLTMLNNRLEVAMTASKDGADIYANDPAFVQYCSLTDPIVKGNNDEKEDATFTLTNQYPTIIDFFEAFSSLFLEPSSSGHPVVPLGEAVAIMHRLQTRYYSISSSSITSPREVAITVGVVHVTTSAGAKIDGVCSNYLARLKPGVDRARISIKESSFRAPKDVRAPMIMIGPGTGLAPMMGFIEDRAVAIREAELTEDEMFGLRCHLFFGCRTDADRIYKDEIQRYDDDGVVKLHLALSRSPGTPKAYVQDRMKDVGKELCDLLLDQSTHFYICGDAKMADECYEVCIEILREHNCMSRVGAVHHLRQMRVQDRWQFDLWGIVHQFQESREAVAKMKRKAAKVWLTRFSESD